jgi:cytochrome c peroxidase
VNVAAARRGREIFRANCTSCHNVDQSKFVPPLLVPMKRIYPGYRPAVLAKRTPPLSPIQNAPGTFDDKMIVVDASDRGSHRGNAMPLLLDLARKPVFLHDASVPSLDALLNPARGATAPHPFYVRDSAKRADTIAFLRGLDTGRR